VSAPHVDSVQRAEAADDGARRRIEALAGRYGEILPVTKEHPSGELCVSEGRVLLYVKEHPGGGGWPPPDAPHA